MPYYEKEIEKRYFSMGEVCDQLDLTPTQIRYWDKEFPQLNIRKDNGGNRIFTKEDIELLRVIKQLVKEQGYTIEGARHRLEYEGSLLKKRSQAIERLKELRGFLDELRKKL